MTVGVEVLVVALWQSRAPQRSFETFWERNVSTSDANDATELVTPMRLGGETPELATADLRRANCASTCLPLTW